MIEVHSETLIAAVSTVIAIAWGTFEKVKGIRSKDHQKVEDAKSELIEIMTKDRDAWKERCESERNEYNLYRAKSHELVNDANAKILRQVEEISMLKVKTDITPMLEYQKAQGEVNERVIQALDKILRQLDAKASSTFS